MRMIRIICTRKAKGNNNCQPFYLGTVRLKEAGSSNIMVISPRVVRNREQVPLKYESDGHPEFHAAGHALESVTLLAQARFYQFRRACRPDRDHAPRPGRAETVDFRKTFSSRLEFLHGLTWA